MTERKSHTQDPQRRFVFSF